MKTMSTLFALLILVISPAQCLSIRSASTGESGHDALVETKNDLMRRDDEDDDDDDDDDDDEVEEVALEDDEEAGGTIFRKGSTWELQTKLRFRGNKVLLKNPAEVPKLVSRIKQLQGQNPGMSFIFCMHIGTSAPAEILTNRKDFMDGRADTFKKAFQPKGKGTAMVDGVKGDVVDHIFHCGTHRFAGVVMKGYQGSAPPECKKGDLVKRLKDK